MFFANRIVGELSAAGKLDTWPDRSKNDENRVQNRSKVDRGRSFGVHRGAQVDRSCPFVASRSAKVDRSGSIEAKPVERAHRAGTRVAQDRKVGRGTSCSGRRKETPLEPESVEVSRSTTCCSQEVTSKNDENELQNRSKVDRGGSVGVRRGAQVDRSWSVGVSRSAKADRSG